MYQSPYMYQNAPQPYQYGMNMPQRFQQPEPQYQAPGPSQNVAWIPVSGLQGAKDHIVQPNTTAWLMDNNDTVFYVKTSDSLGVTNLKAYRFQEINAMDMQAVPDGAQYVSRAEFEQLKNRIEELTITREKRQEMAEKGA